MKDKIAAINEKDMKNHVEISATEPTAPSTRRRCSIRHRALALGVVAVHLLMRHSPEAFAQAPESVAGMTFDGLVTAANMPLLSPPGSRGLLYMDSSGNGYGTLGTYLLGDSRGTYSYSVSGAIGTGIFVPEGGTPFSNTFTFATTSSGTAHLSIGPYFQDVAFELYAGVAPHSIAGNVYYLQVEDGLPPFPATGVLLLKTAEWTAGYGAYSMTGDGLNTTSSSGSYSYSEVNTATRKLLLTDSLTESNTAYLSFSNPISGGFAVTQPSSTGFQVGHFVNLQTAVQITSPSPGPSYTSASELINVGGTATDNLGISQVTWTNNLGGGGLASGTANWTARAIALQPGVNLITITALDKVGNTAAANLAVTYGPTLAITLQGADIILSWPTNFSGFAVESATNLLADGWNTNYPAPVIIAGSNTVIISAVTSGASFYRLFMP